MMGAWMVPDQIVAGRAVSSMRRLSPRAGGYLRARAVIDATLVFLVALGVVVVSVDGPWRDRLIFVAVAMFVAGLPLEILVVNRWKIRYTRYSVDGEMVEVHRGRLFQKRLYVPSRQVLNVESTQGPLLRRQGDVYVKFTCLTEVEKLGPVSQEEFHRIRSLLVAANDRARGQV